MLHNSWPTLFTDDLEALCSKSWCLQKAEVYWVLGSVLSWHAGLNDPVSYAHACSVSTSSFSIWPAVKRQEFDHSEISPHAKAQRCTWSRTRRPLATSFLLQRYKEWKFWNENHADSTVHWGPVSIFIVHTCLLILIKKRPWESHQHFVMFSSDSFWNENVQMFAADNKLIKQNMWHNVLRCHRWKIIF